MLHQLLPLSPFLLLFIHITPKEENYELYTFYKWFLMVKACYDSRLTIAADRIIC
jgi:hypothetical protein